ncbi:MAG: glycerophosphodiester phosphodiesterase [Alphaproteobacteria bacterium]|nr:glycerophosphodiester phosphodiesterase [Alphaproteobacteria bacterium]
MLRHVAIAAIVAAAMPTLAFDLQGHRGARGLAPENTLPAFAAALSLGVDTLELDTGVTKDGIVVIGHDPRLNPAVTRGPDGQWLAATGAAIRDLTWEELQRYDVGRIQPGTRYAETFASQKPIDGTRMPRLADLFALVKKSGNDTVRFNIETKITPVDPQATVPPEPFARALIQAIRDAGMTQRSTIQSFDWRTLQIVQREAPEIATVYLTFRRYPDSGNLHRNSSALTPWTAGFDLSAHGGSVPRMVHAAGGRIWSPFHGDLDDQDLAEAKRLGIQVVVWTVNQPADMIRLIERGVDGIITDRPDLLRQVMADKGMTLPRPTPVAP